MAKTKHTFYFDHDYNARNDQKILELRAEYGWEGYGVYFALVEVLCESNGTIKRGALAGLSLGLNMAKTDLVKMIDFMIEIGLFEQENDLIYSNRVNEHLSFRTLLSEAGKRGGRGNKKPPFSPPLAPLEAGKERKGDSNGIISDVIDDDNGNNNLNILKAEFEIFRVNYPGTKKGLDTEFANFQKKHKDWKDIVPQLDGYLSKQIESRAINKANGVFVPQWKNLQTYINQRAWEEVIPVSKVGISLTSTLKSIWETYYTGMTGASYYFDDKSLIALAEIEVKVKHSVSEGKNPSMPIEQAFEFILNNIKDNWIISNLSLEVINSKYNTIISNIRNNGKPGKQSLDQRLQDLESLANTMYPQ